MAITKQNPNRIHLGGPVVVVNDIVANGAITPGHLLIRASGKYLAHNSAGAATSPTFALEQDHLNKGVTDAYADGDLVRAGIGSPGSTFWALIPSGQVIADGGKLKSNGDGTLIAFVASGTTAPICEAVEAKTAVGPSTSRIRVQVL